MGVVLELPVKRAYRTPRILLIGPPLDTISNDTAFDCDVVEHIGLAVNILNSQPDRLVLVVLHLTDQQDVNTTISQLYAMLDDNGNIRVLVICPTEPTHMQEQNARTIHLSNSSDSRLIRQTVSLVCEHANALDGLDAATQAQRRGLSTLLDQVSLRQEAERQAYRHAHYDSCTELPNRRLFEQRLERALRRDPCQTPTICVVAISIDNLSFLTSALGHDTTDEMLARIANRLRHALDPGCIAGRLDYGDFWLLLTNLKDEGEAEACARTIMRTAEEPMTLSNGRRVDIRCRTGSAIAIPERSTSKSLMRCAMAALNRATECGKFFETADETLMTSAEEKLQTEAELRAGLDGGEFVLHYQPLVSLRDGRIDGFEALIRWQHPRRGMVPPMQFIPVAEESNLIIPIGRWVLQEALREQMKMESLQKRPISMSVNVSAAQLHGSNLIDDVCQALSMTGADPTRLKLELTESELMRDPKNAAATLAELRALHIQVFIDDFGTGYSSLSYLQRLPVDALKIDRSFVVEMLNSADAQAIVRTIIALACSLNLQVVAEGIERAEELHVLRALGCDFGQGYFFSKPTSFESAVQLLQEDKRF